MTRILEIADLRVDLSRAEPRVSPVGPVDLWLDAGECLGIVGESGSGKSLTLKAILDLLPDGLTRGTGTQKIAQGGKLVPTDPRRLRGAKISMISQEPAAALDPLMRIGDLIGEIVRHHSGCSWAEARLRAVDLLRRVGVPDPETRARFWPHELSGGLKQRVVISMALACQSDILLCDEPTTALDVTTEAQILHLLRNLRQSYQGTIVVISHHLGVVAELCDRVYVMYAGQVVEQALVDDLFHAARHPYTRALLACDPASFTNPTPVLPTIPGRLPDLRDPPKGCSFAPRCPLGSARCAAVPPWAQVSPSHGVLCHEVTS